MAQLAFMVLVSERLLGQCTNCESTISSPDKVSSAIGSMNVASGFASFASGANVVANGDFATAIGRYSMAGGDHSVTLGTNINSNGSHAIVIGSGYGPDPTQRLINTLSNSLMVGFNSMLPTFFVSGARDPQSTGKVGIGNITQPEAKLHIRSDPGETAKLILEQPSFREAEIVLGHADYGIRSTDGEGLSFNSRSNFIFRNGKVGIGTAAPEHELDVKGSTATRQFTLFNEDIYKGSIEGWILRSDAQGQAFWTNPALLDDGDWEKGDSSVYRLKGSVGIGTSAPRAQLDLADIFTAGGMNLKIGNDTYLSDVDLSHTLGLLSISDPERGALLLGTDGPLLSGKDRKLGIGTSNPSSTLELNSNISSGGPTGLCIANGSSAKWFMGMNNGKNYINDLVIGNFEALGNDPARFMVLKQDGTIGLGTHDTYSYKLAVNGAILTEEVTVKLRGNWPDYVFGEDYKLMPLGSLSEYINDHGHLPEVPDAGEVSRNGLRLGEMERVLLKKVEELTLYILDQEERINAMENILRSNHN